MLPHGSFPPSTTTHRQQRVSSANDVGPRGRSGAHLPERRPCGTPRPHPMMKSSWFGKSRALPTMPLRSRASRREPSRDGTEPPRHRDAAVSPRGGCAAGSTGKVVAATLPAAPVGHGAHATVDGFTSTTKLTDSVECSPEPPCRLRVASASARGKSCSSSRLSQAPSARFTSSRLCGRHTARIQLGKGPCSHRPQPQPALPAGMLPSPLAP